MYSCNARISRGAERYREVSRGIERYREVSSCIESYVRARDRSYRAADDPRAPVRESRDSCLLSLFCCRSQALRGHALEEVHGERRAEHVRHLRGDRGVLRAPGERPEQRLRLRNLRQQAVGPPRHQGPSPLADHGGKRASLPSPLLPRLRILRQGPEARFRAQLQQRSGN
jgi:hypothetical protein